MPRPLVNNSKYWKASEWKNWFFYYSVFILQDLMEPEYFNHDSQLACGIFILNQSSITPEELKLIKSLLTAFVAKFQTLYNPRYMSFNIHSLLHLSEVVHDLGPLWVTSCFPFEDLLGKMLNFVHGTRYVGLQIYSKVANNIIIANKIHKLPEDSRVKKFCQDLRTIGKRVKSVQQIAEHTFALGKIQRLNVVPFDIEFAVVQRGIEILPAMNIFTFKRLRKRNHVFHSSNYGRETAVDSHWAAVTTAAGESIGCIESFLKICFCDNRNCEVKCNNARFYVLLKRARSTSPFYASTSMCRQLWDQNDEKVTIPYLYKFINEDSAQLLDIESIICLCFKIEVENTIYLARPCNTIEYDQ